MGRSFTFHLHNFRSFLNLFRSLAPLYSLRGFIQCFLCGLNLDYSIHCLFLGPLLLFSVLIVLGPPSSLFVNQYRGAPSQELLVADLLMLSAEDGDVLIFNRGLHKLLHGVPIFDETFPGCASNVERGRAVLVVALDARTMPLALPADAAIEDLSNRLKFPF